MNGLWEQIRDACPAGVRDILRGLLAKAPDHPLTTSGYDPYFHLVRWRIPLTYSSEPVPGHQVLGATSWPGGGPHIVLRSDLFWLEERCVLAHELIHAALGPIGPCLRETAPGLVEVREKIETAIDEIAASRLLPYGPAVRETARAFKDDLGAWMLNVTPPFLDARVRGMVDVRATS